MLEADGIQERQIRDRPLPGGIPVVRFAPAGPVFTSGAVRRVVERGDDDVVRDIDRLILRRAEVVRRVEADAGKRTGPGGRGRASCSSGNPWARSPWATSGRLSTSGSACSRARRWRRREPRCSLPACRRPGAAADPATRRIVEADGAGRRAAAAPQSADTRVAKLLLPELLPPLLLPELLPLLPPLLPPELPPLLPPLLPPELPPLLPPELPPLLLPELLPLLPEPLPLLPPPVPAELLQFARSAPTVHKPSATNPPSFFMVSPLSAHQPASLEISKHA